MSIPVTCECGATLNAKDSFAGRTVACRTCGSPLTIPGEAADLDVAPVKEAPRVVGKKRKKKPCTGGKRDSTAGQTLEARIAARSAAAPREHCLVTVLTGDIRPCWWAGRAYYSESAA